MYLYLPGSVRPVSAKRVPASSDVNEALQRALLGRKTEPPTSPLQVRSGPEGRDHRRLPGDPVVSEQHLKKEMLYRHPELIAALFSCP